MAIDIKKVFADTMVKLLKEKPFDQITIKDLCAACGASRQTFYNHFYDKYDLIVWMCKKQFQALWASFQDHKKSFRDFMIEVYRMFLENQAFYSIVMGIDGPNSFRDFLMGFTKDYYRNALEASGKTMDDELEYVISFCTVGTIEMATNWVKNGFRQTPEQMIEYQLLCCPDLLKPYLE
ncbi:MAG: TetR/AcrR family transcriptional regulator C-terminal domain-containing protein [Lachnospiraceae bacterium]|nr:TetR/AcrR family transcriptional regulator C-terminal domain-containing protein [Lachnospiraceae bacterium]